MSRSIDHGDESASTFHEHPELTRRIEKLERIIGALVAHAILMAEANPYAKTKANYAGALRLTIAEIQSEFNDT